MKVVITTQEPGEGQFKKILMVQDSAKNNYRIVLEALSSHTPNSHLNHLACDIAEDLRNS